MKLFCHFFFGFIFIAFNWARPTYLVIPWNYAQFIEPSSRSYVEQPLSMSRFRRDVPNKMPKLGDYQPLAEASSQYEQQNHNFNPHTYVDYGAHTGNSGSFGWYADFPVQ